MSMQSDQPMTLDSARQKIDALDNEIHDLLMQRAELVAHVLTAKKHAKSLAVNPAREASVLRRLLDRHHGVWPKESIVRIWREIMGAGALLQAKLSVSVSMEQAEDIAIWDSARDYFGSLMPMSKAQNPLAAINQLREGHADFVVLPWPDVEEQKPWWAALNTDIHRDLQIIQRLPFAGAEADKTRPTAIVLAKTAFENTGNDRTFLTVRTIGELSRAGLMDRIARAGLQPVALYASQAGNSDGISQDFLVEIEGYFKSPQDLPQELFNMLQEYEAEVNVTGGYPNSPVYNAFSLPVYTPKSRQKKS